MAKKQVRSAITEEKKLTYVLSFLLFVTFLAMSPALKNDFVSWDDYNYIRDNPIIRDFSLQNILHIFHYKTFVMGNYHPLTMLSYMIEYQLFGVNPFWYHLHNVIFHLINILLVADIVWLLSHRFYATLICAALFAIHPMRVESVVWASERKDVLYSLFFFLAIIQYIYYTQAEKNHYKHLGYAMIFFVLSILSKGQAVVLPLTLILFDYLRSGNFSIKKLPDKIPFFLISLFFGILAVVAQSSSLTETRLVHHSLVDRLLFASYNINAYLFKLVWPFRLACFYGYPENNEMLKVYLSPLINTVLVLLVWYYYRHNKHVIFGILFFLFTIFIVIQILPIGNAIIADRYTYIPYFGLFYAIAMLADSYMQQHPAKKSNIVRLCLILCAVFGIKSYAQSKTWRNNESLWLHACTIDSDDPIINNNLGLHYIDSKQLQKGIEHISRSIANKNVYSETFKAYNNLGKAYSDLKQHNKAFAAFKKAEEEANGFFFEAHFNIGLTFLDMGMYDSAIYTFNALLNKIPGHPESLYSKGMAFKNSNRPDSAIVSYKQAIASRPTYSDALNNLANLYFTRTEYDSAIYYYSQAVHFNSREVNAWLNRSKAYFMKKDYRAALHDAQKAYQLDPNLDKQYMDILLQMTGQKK